MQGRGSSSRLKNNSIHCFCFVIYFLFSPYHDLGGCPAVRGGKNKHAEPSKIWRIPSFHGLFCTMSVDPLLSDLFSIFIFILHVFPTCIPPAPSSCPLSLTFFFTPLLSSSSLLLSSSSSSLLLNVIVSNRILLLGPPHVGRSIPAVTFLVVLKNTCFPTRICTSPIVLFCCRGVCRGDLHQKGLPFHRVQVLVAWNSPDTKANKFTTKKQRACDTPHKMFTFLIFKQQIGE